MNKREVGSFSIIKWFKRGFHLPKLRYNSDLGRVEPDEIEPRGHSGKLVTAPVQICDHGLGYDTMLLAAKPNYRRYITRISFANLATAALGPLDTDTMVQLNDNGVQIGYYALRIPPFVSYGLFYPPFEDGSIGDMEFGDGKGVLLVVDGQLVAHTWTAADPAMMPNYNPFPVGVSLEYYEKPIN